MDFSVSISVKPSEENDFDLIQKFVLLAAKNSSPQIVRVFFDGRDSIPEKIEKSDCIAVFEKKSIDARHGKVKILLRYRIFAGEKPQEQNALPLWKTAHGSHSVIIVGSGPAGLFAALRLLEAGVKPVIVERGERADERTASVKNLCEAGTLNAESNFCFGEGGAGTFSDGKLYTRSTKRGDISKIYRIFVEFGADERIMTDAHPHIGTDRLPSIIRAIREKIISLGGEFLFKTKCVDFILDEPNVKTLDEKKKIRGIVVEKDGERREIFGDAVILATGHSAIDIYSLIARVSPNSIEAKTFAVGVRVEHPRALIDAIQFHGKMTSSAAEYRLTTQIDSRGVYSFCMCPGGSVVPCATAENQIVVNGMSAAARNGAWSNSAIVVETRPDDIPEEFLKKAEEIGSRALLGLLWRTHLEEETAKRGSGQNAPSQRLTDFLLHQFSDSLPPTSYAPGLVSSRLDEWLPKSISLRLQAAFGEFEKSMKGFVTQEAVLIASETRTSTPVRILRDKESLESIGIARLYPSGEGAGYSGGIGSSAMDGERVAAKVLENIMG